MANIRIEIDDALYERLIGSAESRGRSIEAEALELLRLALARKACGPSENIVDAARRLFGPENGIDLDLPSRSSGRVPPDFTDGY